MNLLSKSDRRMEDRLFSRLLDVFIRAGLIIALTLLCYRIFSPFLALMVWALILAVSIYPLHLKLANMLGGRQGLAATLLTLVFVVVIVAPTSVLVASLGDSLEQLVDGIKNSTLQIPPPRAGVADWPVVGKKIHAFWSQAHADLPALIQSQQPKIGELGKQALLIVASIGSGLLQFLASFIIAGIIMAFGASGAEASREIFERIAGTARGAKFAELSTATIRAVAQGVIGVAFIQAIIIGLALLVAGVPWVGVLTVIVLVLGIAQIPAAIVTLPAIGWIWSSGDYSTTAAAGYTVLLFISGMADNVLKPIMLGRGVEAPMPVILLGALGGMATTGILGMFVGATLLALGYQIFMVWVANNPDREQESVESESQTAA
jgi:predicted PurR-regulated permease PerM